MKKIRIAILGLGRWGSNYLRTFQMLKNVEVTHVCTRKKSDAEKKIKTLGIEYSGKITTDYREILSNKSIDAVAIVTPGATHYQFAKKALQAKKHVLVEKPLTLSVEQAKELTKFAQRKKRILMVGHLHRYNPAIEIIKKDLKKGIIGKIQYIQTIGTGNGPIRSDTNVLWDFFPHDITILSYLLDSVPQEVNAQGAAYIKKNNEDVVTMNLQFPNNIFTISMASWLYPFKKREVIIVGETGYIVFDDYAKKEKVKYFKKESNEEYKSPEISDKKPLTEELKHFVECIVKKKKPMTDGFEGVKIVAILEAADRSLKKKGEPIKIPKISTEV
ncbi:Gfo/Idh/MocA family oxidoreductase [Candidatus Woesearchaeota archaeon]|nr:Gfo/Idh/MocA family oxidoreductase [Candidatus Woesearchaeota archaeon]